MGQPVAVAATVRNAETASAKEDTAPGGAAATSSCSIESSIENYIKVI